MIDYNFCFNIIKNKTNLGKLINSKINFDFAKNEYESLYQSKDYLFRVYISEKCILICPYFMKHNQKIEINYADFDNYFKLEEKIIEEINYWAEQYSIFSLDYIDLEKKLNSAGLSGLIPKIKELKEILQDREKKQKSFIERKQSLNQQDAIKLLEKTFTAAVKDSLCVIHEFEDLTGGGFVGCRVLLSGPLGG